VDRPDVRDESSSSTFADHQYPLRRDSKAVMQRPAKPFRPVRLRLAPPGFKRKALTRQGFSFVCGMPKQCRAPDSGKNPTLIQLIRALVRAYVIEFVPIDFACTSAGE
jgi:hypothetical protein